MIWDENRLKVIFGRFFVAKDVFLGCENVAEYDKIGLSLVSGSDIL